MKKIKFDVNTVLVGALVLVGGYFGFTLVVQPLLENRSATANGSPDDARKEGLGTGYGSTPSNKRIGDPPMPSIVPDNFTKAISDLMYAGGSKEFKEAPQGKYIL